LGWSICPDKGGQFRPEMGGQFAPDSLVNLFRIQVVKFIGFSTQATVWWPTQSLIDSVAEQKIANRELKQQKEQLNTVLQSVRDSCFDSRFNKIVPIVVPKSSSVVSGGSYEADVFAAVSYLKDDAEIMVDGKPISIERDPKTGIDVGRIKFIANSSAYDPNTLIARKTFEAAIEINDTTYKAVTDYFVAKPVIRITTGNAPTLYMGCGNRVMIEVPALGTSYNPSFGITGGEIIKGAKIGEVIIIPNQRKVSVSVSNSGSSLGSEPFDVKDIPRPSIIAIDNNGRTIDKNGINVTSAATIRVVANPDQNFKEEVPKDANFRIRNMSVTLARGTSQVMQKKVTDESIDLSDWQASMRAGDRLIIEPLYITRMTFKGNAEIVPVMPGDIITIPIK